MIDLFKSKEKKHSEFLNEWRPIIQSAKNTMPDILPSLHQSYASFFIDEWNSQYEIAEEQEKIGLAVLAYRIKINQYATGMLIDGNEAIRLNGIKLLGYMRDEASWHVMSALVKHENSETSFAAFGAALQINERRACDEFFEFALLRKDWNAEAVANVLKDLVEVNIGEYINKLDSSSVEQKAELKQQFLRS